MSRPQPHLPAGVLAQPGLWGASWLAGEWAPAGPGPSWQTWGLGSFPTGRFCGGGLASNLAPTL